MMPAIFISASGQTPPKTPQDVLQGIPLSLPASMRQRGCGALP